MNNISAVAGDSPSFWRALQERIGEYLCREGVPWRDAGRLSQAVIRTCADAADSVDRGLWQERAMQEAQTLLQTWQTRQRERSSAAPA